MNIAVLDDYQNVVPSLACFKLLADHRVLVFNDTPKSREHLIDRLKDQDCIVLIRERTKIDASLLKHLPHLKLISQTGKISNHLSLQACTRHGVAVAEGKGSPIAPSELCWALIMAAARHLVPYCRNLKQGVWQNSGSLGLGRTLNGRVLGVWGYGKIGKRIAAYGKAFGMRVLVWGSEDSRQQALLDGYAAAESKVAFFAQSDVLSLHLRLNAATRECVRYLDLAQMKPDSLFVNISRAGLVERGALYKALIAGRPGYAALDVYESEPATLENDPLLSLENVLCTPHIGYVERNSYDLYFEIAFKNIVAFFSGSPQNIANPEVLDRI